MRNARNVAVVLFTLAVVATAGCRCAGGPGAECTANSDCRAGLACLLGVCTESSSADSGGAPADSGGAPADSGGAPADSGGLPGSDAGNMTGDSGLAVGCGDLVCDPAECGICTPDCGASCTPGGGCGDGTCDASESCTSCPADCATGCGDGCCLINEDCLGCPADCVTVESCDPSACGNGQCNYGLSETCLNCPDCFGLCDCGDGTCAGPETAANCPWDC
jgi:hypothetical protein